MDRKSFQYLSTKINDASEFLKKEYGVKSLCIFGSYARGDEKLDSDIDILVDIPPKAMKLVSLKFFLQDLLGKPVDLIRKRSTLDPFLMNEIKRDGITLF